MILIDQSHRFQIDHVSIRGDLVKLRLFHYGGRIFPNPYMAVAELKPGKRLDISALPTGSRLLRKSDRPVCGGLSAFAETPYHLFNFVLSV